MAGNDTRQLQLQISASAELMIRNLRQADAEVAKFQSSTAGRLASIDQRFAALGKLKNGLSGITQVSGVEGLITAGVGVTLIDLARRALDYAGSLQEVSQQLGITTTDLQVYRYAASQAGVEQETIEKSLAKLTLTMGKAQDGAKGPAQAFDALGISLQALRGKTAGEIMPAIADGLAKIPDPARRAAIEVALFGRAAQALDGLLAGGSAGISAFAREAEELGLVLSAKEIAEADRTADKLGQVKAVLEANIARSVTANADAIYELAGSLGTLIVKATAAGSAYQGFLRIVQNEGGRGFLRTITGDGKDQAEAGTAHGYSGQKIREFREATAAYRRAQRNPNIPANVRKALLDQAVLARDRATRAVGAEVADSSDIRKAVALARAQLQPEGSNPATKTADGGGRKRSGTTAEQQRRQAEAEARRDRADQGRAADLASRFQMDVATGRADLSLDPDERLKIELQRIDLARDARERDLEEQALDNRYVAANLKSLKLANEEVASLDKQVATRRRAQQADAAAEARTQAAADDQIALLELTGRLTDIAAERRRIDERILALKQEEERKQLERVANDRNGRYTPDDQQLARDRLARLPSKQAAERADLAQQNAGPIGQYFRQLKSDAGDLDEALQSVAARGLASIEDEAAGTIASLIKVRGAFGGLVNGVLADLARLAVRQGLLSLLGSFGGTPKGAGSTFGSLDIGAGGITSTPGFAVGGSMLIGGQGGVDRNVLSLNGAPIARVSRGERLSVSTGNPSASAIGMLGGGGGSAGGGMSTIRLLLSEDLNARIEGVSAGIAVQVVRAAAPEIAQAATDGTIATLSRQRM